MWPRPSTVPSCTAPSPPRTEAVPPSRPRLDVTTKSVSNTTPAATRRGPCTCTTEGATVCTAWASSSESVRRMDAMSSTLREAPGGLRRPIG